jgi:RING-H2 zinc finger domain
MSFQIKKVKLLNSWCYNLESNKDCPICRVDLNLNSIYQESNKDSIVIPGMCGHSFHCECITSWIKQNHHCPICFTKWIPRK